MARMARIRWLLLAHLLRLAPAFDISPHYNFASLLHSWDTQESTEELATATITIRGGYSAALLPTIEASIEGVLRMFCAEGSILIFTERLVSDVGGGTYSTTVEFQILPPKDGGGDCAWELRAAAYGADGPPFDQCDDNCPRQKPLFRRALENQIWMYPATRALPTATWYVRMFSIFCHRLEVVRPSSFPAMETKDWRCEDFFVEATAHPPDPGAVLTTPATGETITTTRNVVSSDDPCSWISSSCLCATVASCSWVNNLGACIQVPVPHSNQERCGFCPTLPWCDPGPTEECPTALTICSCSLMGPKCNWTLESGRCFAPTTGPTGVPCSLCPLSTANCPRPIVTAITPPADALLGFADLGYDLTLTFDRPVRFPRPSDTITGDIYLSCALEEGQYLPWDSPQGGTLRIEVPVSKREILDGGLRLRLQLSDQSFWSRYLCTLNVQDGAMVDVAEDVPCVAASWHRAAMSDNIAPLATAITPQTGSRDIALDTAEATVRFNEPVFLMIREVAIHRLDPSSGPERYDEVGKLPVTITDTEELLETVKISLSVELEHDAVYSIQLPAGLVVDRANNAYAGLEVGTWGFRTEAGTRFQQGSFGGLSAGAIAGIATGIVLFLGAMAAILFFLRWKVVKKYEDRSVKPEEGSTPKASQVQTLRNDAEHLPSNERFWERALIRSKEDVENSDVMADVLEDLPGSIPASHKSSGSRRPSNASNAETNQRRPSNASNLETNQRRPSNVSSSAPVGRIRNPSKQSSQNSRHGSKQSNLVVNTLPARRPSKGNEMELHPNEARRPSASSANGTGSLALRSAGLAGKLQAPNIDSIGSANFSERRQVSKGSQGSAPPPLRDASPSRFLEGSQVLREEAESMAASRRAMLGLGPAQPPKPHSAGTSRTQMSRSSAT